MRVVIVTLDNHLASTTERARATLAAEVPGLTISLHAASAWGSDPAALARCRADIATGDIIIASMLFMDDHIQAVIEDLKARRDHCDAMIGCMSAGEIIRLTRLGSFKLEDKEYGAIALLKKLRGSKKPGESSGANQMAMLRRLPKILRFIPGTAQDVRAYFLTLQYWLAGSEDNVANMVRFLVGRYATGARKGLVGRNDAPLPVEYPEVGVYHPRMAERISASSAGLPALSEKKGRVGLLLMRSYLLAGNTRHYDGVIAALESKGLEVVPAFASGLDARPAIERFFINNGRPAIDALVSLTGFSLVGGPAYNDARGAEEILARLDVPYIAAHATEFQTLEQWESADRGLLPVEATMMVAIPELDGATGPILFGGRSSASPEGLTRDIVVHPERAARLAQRVAKMVALRRKPVADRKVAIVLFNFPPNGGAVGTAAFLSVFSSLRRVLAAMRAEGYNVPLPGSEEELRERLIEGNAPRFGTPANVHARIAADDHVRRERHLGEIEAQWGPAPGKHNADGSSLLVLGERFGNVLVGIQPSFGYEGDPMRLLFERGFAPTHAFSAFYRYLREDFGADVVLHFGTHGALEFMPGKQTGLSGACWPDRLIGDLPNVYLYAANNPSEGTIAKRRAAATLVSYLTPPVAKAGVYKGLAELKSSMERWRALPPEDQAERERLAEVIQAQAAELNLAAAEPAWRADALTSEIARLVDAVRELEYTLIPCGLHVVGEPTARDQRIELVESMATVAGDRLSAETLAAIVDGEPVRAIVAKSGLPRTPELETRLAELAASSRLLAEDHEIPAIMRALEGRFIRPAPSGDLLRTPAILPTGRNIHGFDPYRMPSRFAMTDGAQQAERLLKRFADDGHALPETIAMVLWGTDNLKSEGGPIAQVMALIGAAPRFDSFGRLCGASLIPLNALGRPRIDVVVTLSGIFRDLLPLQTRMLAEACWLAASADEAPERNFVRKHALAYADQHGCDLETAALRVFSNADGAYGSNVNHMIEAGSWRDEDELAETYTRRKCFAFGRNGEAAARPELLNAVLKSVKLSYQNLESVELGVTTVDHYFDTLGGISRAVRRAGGSSVPVYIGDQTRSEGVVRTLSEQVALETRTRTSNPKWYEGMLKHGYEGVRQIETQVTNTLGWSATTGQVAPWVYQDIAQTFVLDPEMRARLAALNPAASVKLANRLLEAHERHYWRPDDETLDALRNGAQELEDRLEGVGVEAAA